MSCTVARFTTETQGHRNSESVATLIALSVKDQRAEGALVISISGHSASTTSASLCLCVSVVNPLGRPNSPPAEADMLNHHPMK